MIRIVMAALAALTLCASQALADDYPNRPIRVFTTSSAGGISDVFMRVLGDQLRSQPRPAADRREQAGRRRQ